jgi:hypothetical protein
LAERDAQIDAARRRQYDRLLDQQRDAARLWTNRHQ